MVHTLAEWQELAGKLNFDGRPFINGTRRDAASSETITKMNPATGKPLSRIDICGQSDVDEAVSAARNAYQNGPWRLEGVAYRQEKLRVLADLLDQHSDELALFDSLEMGKPVREAALIDVPGSAALFRFYAETIDKVEDSLPITPSGSTAMVTRESLGVVGVIVPWNFPLEILTWKLAPALAAGNTVVVKPSLEATHSALKLAELATAAGIPDGVVNVVTGTGSLTGQAIARHPDIDMVAFTGSTEVAKQLQISAGESNLKRLSLEAGGKSSNIIFADTENLQLAANRAAFGAFYNQGEVCSANSRIFVQESIFEEFVDLLVEEAKGYYPGNPLDPEVGMGSLVSKKHADEVWAAIEDAKRSGQILVGGNRITIDESDAFIEPTIVTGVPLDHILHTREIFGPVAVITAFKDENEVIALANGTPFGLAASVWTQNISRANRVASKLVAGTVSVNTVDALSFTTPFGGFKQSGFGRDLSIHALNNYTDLKTTWIQWA